MFVGSWGVGIRRITPQGLISTVVAGRDCNTGPPTLCNPNGIALDSAGDVLAAEHECRVHKVRQDGTVSTIAGTLHPVYGVVRCGYSGDGGAAVEAVMGSAYGIAADRHGNLFVADTKHHCIRRVDSEGIIETFAGVCGNRGSYSGDLGPATEARLRRPHGVAVDADGEVSLYRRHGKLSHPQGEPRGTISTVAGNGVDSQ